MSLFKTNFMKLVEAYLQNQGFTIEMCNIYTRGVDYYESYKRVIMCAYKDDLLLCIRARSGAVSDPFVGDDEQIELKLQEPALKLLSCIRSLNMGADPIFCEKFEKMMEGKMKKIILIATISLSCVVTVWAQEDGGQAGNFLRFGVGGRALGMGRSFVSIADDASGVYWNPAGIVGT